MFIQKFIDKHPKASFMLFSKFFWIIGFFFTIYVINNQLPTLRQFLLASMYTILTLPVSHWLTYSFENKINDKNS